MKWAASFKAMPNKKGRGTNVPLPSIFYLTEKI